MVPETVVENNCNADSNFLSKNCHSFREKILEIEGHCQPMICLHVHSSNISLKFRYSGGSNTERVRILDS